MSRPIQALVHLGALRHNLGEVRRYAPGAAVMAVIKANAYGHGVLRTARALSSAEGFGLLELDAAVQLREAGHAQRILLLEGFFAEDELEAIARHRLAAVIHSFEQIDMLRAAPDALALDAFLKINSGMNRLGFKPQDFPRALEQLRAHARVRSITLMTHFANADEEVGIDSQFEQFSRLAHGLEYQRSSANSAAIMRFPHSHQDWVRAGVMLYGVSPFAGRVGLDEGLRPAMTLQSRIIAMQRLEPGESVGYGATFVAPAPMRIGVVACGYADGYPRHAPSGTPVLVEGVQTRTVGRVAMDMLCVDVSEIAHARVGSRVTLWGGMLPVERVAHAAGTIAYELLCAVAPRVPMIDTEEG